MENLHSVTTETMIRKEVSYIRAMKISVDEVKMLQILKANRLRDWMLLFAMMAVMVTYMAALRFASSTNQLQENTGSMAKHLFILCNSSLFVASLIVVMSLLNQYKLKPWPQIALLMLFGCYVLLVRKISPSLVLPLLVLSIPPLLLAAAGKLRGFPQQSTWSSSGDDYSAL